MVRITRFIPIEFLQCRVVVLEAVEQCFQLYIDHSYNSFKSWKFDKEILKRACRAQGAMQHYGDPSIAFDRDVTEIAMQSRSFTIGANSELFEQDKSFLIKVLEFTPVNYFLIDSDLSLDSDIVEMAARGGIGDFASYDEKLLKISVRANGMNLKILESCWFDNYEIVKLSVNQNGLALEFASDRLKDDKSIVKLAVHQNGMALEFASENLRNDRTIVMAALKQNGLAVQFASTILKSDKVIGKEALFQNALSIEYLRDVSLEIINCRDNSMKEMTNEMISESIRKRDELLKHIPQDRLNDKPFVEKALLTNINIYDFLPQYLKMDKNFLLKIKPPELFQNTAITNLFEDEEFFLNCIKQMPYESCYHNFTPSQLSNRDYIKKIIHLNPCMMTHNKDISSTFCNDRELTCISIKQGAIHINSQHDLLGRNDVVLELGRSAGLFLELLSPSPIPFHLLLKERLEYEYGGVIIPKQYYDCLADHQN